MRIFVHIKKVLVYKIGVFIGHGFLHVKKTIMPFLVMLNLNNIFGEAECAGRGGPIKLFEKIKNFPKDREKGHVKFGEVKCKNEQQGREICTKKDDCIGQKNCANPKEENNVTNEPDCQVKAYGHYSGEKEEAPGALGKKVHEENNGLVHLPEKNSPNYPHKQGAVIYFEPKKTEVSDNNLVTEDLPAANKPILTQIMNEKDRQAQETEMLRYPPVNTPKDEFF